MGRPRTIKSPEEFDRLVDEYVEMRRREDKPILLTGCLNHMKIWGRSALAEYEGYDDGAYSNSVKRFRQLIEAEYEERMHKNNPAGAIFALKNMGWRDQQDVKLGADDKLKALFEAVSGRTIGVPSKVLGDE